ncbi:uncharacterized protein LOC112693929 isoform X2 [Sipha flava]|uniref:Uncharacterized protein LOC112693929 isoform X2 n=1 Tax=Sipha flava TaxID=143950 RepID=A0A8B8GPI7_9HEMI|nr:uncharacterized protein LOC112693929 isoform X2 [Sipha flava]
MENQSIENKSAIMSPPKQVLPTFVPQQPPPHSNQIHLQTDFTSPPPTHPHGFWPQQAFPNTWQTQFRMANPAPQAKTTVTNTTTCNNLTTFSSSSNSTIRSPLTRWRSFNSSSRQRTPYQYGNTPRNNYPRQFSQNANGNFFGNSSQNPQTPSTSSTQNWPQFNQRPRFIPRQHMRMNRPRSSVQIQSNGTNQDTNAVTECKTRKRKLKSQQSGEPQRAQKPWNREDAVKAIAAEMELRTPKNNQQIMIRFPDHEITRQIVQNFHTDIKSVHFHTPCNPRYCYVQVQPTANIEDVAKELNKTVFQHENLRVEIKESQFEEKAFPECIDPYTLYLGNLPTNITSNAVKDEFPKATRVDIGFAKKMKYTRYAFIKFSNAEDAIQAYKEKYNLVIDSRSVVLRFRRGKGNVNPPGQVDKLPNEMNEFDVQSLRKKIKREPIEENAEEYDAPPINVSRVVKPEMMEEDEYDQDSVYESHVSESYENDINIKSECPDFEEDYEEQYYDEEESRKLYTFRRNETMSMDVVLADNNRAQCVQNNHSHDIAIPHGGVEDEERQWNEKPEEEEELLPHALPYSFLPKKVVSENNSDITLPTTNEIRDDDSDRENERWNNSSNDEDDDGGGTEYSWQRINEKNKSTNQTKEPSITNNRTKRK